MERDEIAILMAAGLGMRMLPLTEKLPKPLIKVGKQTLIETIIAGLEVRGVREIYVVVGYLKEQFAFLGQKYTNITFIENTEYLKKNNISSLYAVGDILGSADCFICEADLYVSDPQIFLREFLESCYWGKMVKGHSDDWVFDLSDGRIVRVKKGGADQYNMVGISYWKKQDAKKIQKAIVKAYQRAGHEQMFWDEIVDRELEHLQLTVSEVKPDEVVEVDTEEELRLLCESVADENKNR